MTENKYLDIKGLSEHLLDKPKKRTIYDWTSNGKIPFFKRGKKIFFDREVIDRWDNLGRPDADSM